MLTLEQKAVILGAGGPLLSRFTAAVSERLAMIDKELATSPRRTFAKAMLNDARMQWIAHRVLHCAMGETNALTEKGEAIDDEEVRLVVATYLDMVARLLA